MGVCDLYSITVNLSVAGTWFMGMLASIYVYTKRSEYIPSTWQHYCYLFEYMPVYLPHLDLQSK